MSDTVNLIIEIPKELYDGIECRNPELETEYVCYQLMKAVDNGIPLDDIKADIQKTITASWYNGENYKKNYRDGLDNALKIIDKHLADTRGE